MYFYFVWGLFVRVGVCVVNVLLRCLGSIYVFYRDAHVFLRENMSDDTYAHSHTFTYIYARIDTRTRRVDDVNLEMLAEEANATPTKVYMCIYIGTYVYIHGCVYT